MRVEKDYEERLELLNRHEVRYCIVRAFAVALHARPRDTRDLDILVDTTDENAARVLAALRDFGFGSVGLQPGDFTRPGQIIQLDYEPVRVDLLTAIAGLPFDGVWERRITAPLALALAGPRLYLRPVGSRNPCGRSAGREGADGGRAYVQRGA